MITESASPSELVAFSRNPIAWELVTDNLYTTAGVKAVSYLYVRTSSGLGATIEINWGTHSITFTGVAALTGSGEEFRVWTGDPLATFTNQVLADLDSNYDLHNDFVLTYGGIVSGKGLIIFTAREEGSDYTMIIPTEPLFWSSTAPFTVGVTAVKRTEFSMLLQLEVEEEWMTGVWTRFYEERRNPDADGLVKVEYQHLFHSRLRDCLPEFAMIWQVYGIRKRFRVRYGEQYAGTTYGLFTTDIITVMRGGIAEWVRSLLTPAFFDSGSTYQKFLTWYPDRKKVSTEQIETLRYILMDASVATARQKVKLYWTDGTDTTYTAGSILMNGQGDCYDFPCGYYQLSLGAVDPLKNVLKWQVWLIDTYGTTISNTRNFTLDEHFYEQEQFLMVENALGGTDTVRITGSVEESTEAQIEVFEGARPADMYVSEHSIYTRVRGAAKVFKTSTSILTTEEARYMEQLLLSEYIWLVAEGDWRPVRINQNSIKTVTLPGGAHSVEFSYVSALPIVTWTPEDAVS